ncbi:MAG: sulfotransferase [Acidimicrobiales bacterium]|nr:sulfotransferase [Acidimicrobiales bacterium]
MSTNADFAARPIVVGALGGSGTRVIGAILMAADVHLGSNLNIPNDNLTVSMLMNRPRHMRAASDAEILATFERVQRFLLGDAGVTDLAAVWRAALTTEHPNLARRLRYALGAVRERGPKKGAVAWGYKEPNTHLFLPQLRQLHPGLRFVYVMRHPLDMAFTQNLQQLNNWAPFFDIDVPADAKGIQIAQVDLWLHATERAHRLGPELLRDRFYSLDYERLIRDPEPEITKLVSFLGLDDSPARISQYAELVGTPETVGRYKNYDLGHFRPDQLEGIARWGFTVDLNPSS